MVSSSSLVHRHLRPTVCIAEFAILTGLVAPRAQEDEKRLASECELLGPLIGFPGPGKRGHCTVAKLARAIVAGSVRRACESRVG